MSERPAPTDGSRVYNVDTKMLTCGICLDLFEDPRRLPCSHVFCADCLQGVRDSLGGSQIKCPECRATHEEPVNQLLADRHLESMVENIRCSGHGQQPNEELKEYQVFVKGLNDATNVISVTKETTVAELKQKLVDRTAVPSNQWYLTFQSKPLQDDKATMEKYNVKEHNTLQMNGRCHGGNQQQLHYL